MHGLPGLCGRLPCRKQRPDCRARTKSLRGRGNHWIRIERYWEGEYPNVKARFLPVFCQQCGNAPCEPVCPVYASYHSEQENLNVQVYNRCVGTRYCGNNCPYRVRIFNYFAPHFDEPLEQQLNPDVTVRSAGVMEKCTFCIQRIRRARRNGQRRKSVAGRWRSDAGLRPGVPGGCAGLW